MLLLWENKPISIKEINRLLTLQICLNSVCIIAVILWLLMTWHQIGAPIWCHVINKHYDDFTMTSEIIIAVADDVAPIWCQVICNNYDDHVMVMICEINKGICTHINGAIGIIPPSFDLRFWNQDRLPICVGLCLGITLCIYRSVQNYTSCVMTDPNILHRNI